MPGLVGDIEIGDGRARNRTLEDILPTLKSFPCAHYGYLRECSSCQYESKISVGDLDEGISGLFISYLDFQDVACEFFQLL